MKEPAQQEQAGRGEKGEGGEKEEERGGGDLLPKYFEESIAQRTVRRRGNQRDVTNLRLKDDLRPTFFVFYMPC